MAAERSERVLVVELTITEYEDGARVNEAKLRREGAGDYLATAKRVLDALSGTEASDG